MASGVPVAWTAPFDCTVLGFYGAQGGNLAFLSTDPQANVATFAGASGQVFEVISCAPGTSQVSLSYPLKKDEVVFGVEGAGAVMVLIVEVSPETLAEP